MATFLSTYMKAHPIPAFFLLTFAIAWSIWLPLGTLAPESFLLSLPGAWAPTLSALLVIWHAEGRQGMDSFLKRLLHWRVGLQWYLVVLFGTAAIAYLAIRIGVLFGAPVPQSSLPSGVTPQSLPVVLPVIFLINIFLGGPLAEDIGWRGYILPKLREKMSTLAASLLIGIVWAVWHLPYFIFPMWRGLVGNLPFLWFTFLTTGWSVLFAWVYINTGSILMPVLFHAAINTTLGSLGVLGQENGNMIPLVFNTMLTWLAVGGIVAVFGRELKRETLTSLKGDQPSLGHNTSS